MTRVHLLSDLHTEVSPYAPADDLACDVVVLAGDIGKGVRGIEWARRAFPDVDIVYVAGNHEYYGEAVPHLTDKLRARAAELGVHFLEDDEVTAQGATFIGATLWADFALFGDEKMLWAMENCRQGINDYRLIRSSPRFSKLAPRDTQLLHRTSVKRLAARFEQAREGPVVVVTHHAPSLRSTRERYRDSALTASYASHLDELVARCGASLWVHGHTHYVVDYTIGDTRVRTNPRGYPGERVEGFDPRLVIDV
jgi:predicted phosphodiesterase